MVTTSKNPLADKKWQKKFMNLFKKAIQQKQKSSPQRIISEINCTQADIGEPSYPTKPKRKKLSPKSGKKVKNNICPPSL